MAYSTTETLVMPAGLRSVKIMVTANRTFCETQRQVQAKVECKQQKAKCEKELYHRGNKFAEIKLEMWALKRSLSETHRDAQEA